MIRSQGAQRAKRVAERTLLLREQGVASSNLVIPTSIYKERPSKESLISFSSGTALYLSSSQKQCGVLLKSHQIYRNY